MVVDFNHNINHDNVDIAWVSCARDVPQQYRVRCVSGRAQPRLCHPRGRIPRAILPHHAQHTCVLAEHDNPGHTEVRAV